MLAGMAKSRASPEFAGEPVQMFERGLAALLHAGRMKRPTLAERARYGADEPGRADR